MDSTFYLSLSPGSCCSYKQNREIGEYGIGVRIAELISLTAISYEVSIILSSVGLRLTAGIISTSRLVVSQL